MRRHKRAIRGVVLPTRQGNFSSTNNARIFRALSTVNSAQLRILGSSSPSRENVATAASLFELELNGYTLERKEDMVPRDETY